MARYAMVHTDSGFVANVIEWDGDTGKWQPPVDYTMVEDTEGRASGGYKWDGTKFDPPPSGLPGTQQP